MSKTKPPSLPHPSQMTCSSNVLLSATARIQDYEYLYAASTNVSSFVSVKLSGSHNYLLWKAQMVCLLDSKNMCGIIDATFVAPRYSGTEIMRQYDSLVRGWIFGSVTEEVLVDVFNLDSAKAVWEKLKSIYDPTVSVQIVVRDSKKMEWSMSPMRFPDDLWDEIDNLDYSDTNHPYYSMPNLYCQRFVQVEQSMKNTAESFSISAALITAIVFAAGITILDVNNKETELLAMEVKTPLVIFIISNAISLFASNTALLVFLSFLTSDFSEKDFLLSLPRRLFIGLFSFFLCIAAVMVSLGATLYLVFCDKKPWKLVLICGLLFITIAFFVTVKSPLMVDLFTSTYSRIFGKQRKNHVPRDFKSSKNLHEVESMLKKKRQLATEPINNDDCTVLQLAAETGTELGSLSNHLLCALAKIQDIEYLYASNTDVSSFVPVSVPCCSDYLLWKAQMIFLLESKRMCGIMGSTFIRSSDPGMEIMRQYDSLVRGWIFGCVTEDVPAEVFNLSSAKAVCEKLKFIYDHTLCLEKVGYIKKKEWSVIPMRFPDNLCDAIDVLEQKKIVKDILCRSHEATQRRDNCGYEIAQLANIHPSEGTHDSENKTSKSGTNEYDMGYNSAFNDDNGDDVDGDPVNVNKNDDDELSFAERDDQEQAYKMLCRLDTDSNGSNEKRRQLLQHLDSYQKKTNMDPAETSEIIKRFETRELPNIYPENKNGIYRRVAPSFQVASKFIWSQGSETKSNLKAKKIEQKRECCKPLKVTVKADWLEVKFILMEEEDLDLSGNNNCIPVIVTNKHHMLICFSADGYQLFCSNFFNVEEGVYSIEAKLGVENCNPCLALSKRTYTGTKEDDDGYYYSFNADKESETENEDTQNSENKIKQEKRLLEVTVKGDWPEVESMLPEEEEEEELTHVTNEDTRNSEMNNASNTDICQKEGNVNAKRLDLAGPTVEQPEYNLLSRRKVSYICPDDYKNNGAWTFCLVLNLETNEMVAMKMIMHAFDNYMEVKKTLDKINLFRHLNDENTTVLSETGFWVMLAKRCLCLQEDSLFPQPLMPPQSILHSRLGFGRQTVVEQIAGEQKVNLKPLRPEEEPNLASKESNDIREKQDADVSVETTKDDEGANPIDIIVVPVKSPPRNEEKKLHEVTMKGDWSRVISMVKEDKSIVTVTICRDGRVILHIAVGRGKNVLVINMLPSINSEQVLEKREYDGSALHTDADAIYKQAADLLVKKTRQLSRFEDQRTEGSLHIAYENMHLNTFRYLLKAVNDDAKTMLQSFLHYPGDEIAVRHVIAIAAEQYGFPSELLQTFHKFASKSDAVLMAIAKSFQSVASFILCKSMEEQNEVKKVLEMVCNEIDKLEYSRTYHPYYTRPIFEAACQTVVVVVHDILIRSPKAIRSTDKNGYAFIQLAILHHSEKRFNFLSDVGECKDLYRALEDSSKINLLPIVGKLSTSNILNQKTRSAASELQRNLLLQEEMKKFVFPTYITKENYFKETPYMLFTREHKKLVKEGESWMRTMTKSCSITAALITTLLCTAVITILGGSDKEVESILKKGEDPETKVVTKRNSVGGTLLHIEAIVGNKHAPELLGKKKTCRR